MRILAADIGGTNSRFGLFETEPLRLIDMIRLSSDVPDFFCLLDRLALERPDMAPEKVDRLSLAVAGPVEKRGGAEACAGRAGPTRVRLSNLPWVMDLDELRKRRPGGAVFLINDFEAQAWACLLPDLLVEALSILPGDGGGEVKSACSLAHSLVCCDSPRALMGAGTGLGMALLMPAQGGSRIFPSEGGHAAFPFVTRQEREFGDFVVARKGLAYARGDDVVSGPGLALLDEFLTGQRREPAELTADADFAHSPVCGIFGRFYARAARNLALTCLPRAGLILTGGLAANCPALVNSDEFRHEFLNAPESHRDVLSRIPILLNRNQLSGLWGAAHAAVER